MDPQTPSDSDPRFAADVMLGSLARWLRILGYDTSYDNRIEDEDLVRCCQAEGRVVLTRDRRLVQRRALSRSILIRSQRLGEQLRQVLEEVGHEPDPRRLFRRCLNCNLPLEPADSSAVAASVPAYVWRTQQVFRTCPGCHRIFWAGTHRSRVLRLLQEWWTET